MERLGLYRPRLFMDNSIFCRTFVDHGGLQPFSAGWRPYRYGFIMEQLCCFLFQIPSPQRADKFPGSDPDHDPYQHYSRLPPGLYSGLPDTAQMAAYCPDDGNSTFLDILCGAL